MMYIVGYFVNGDEYREKFAGAPQLDNKLKKVLHNAACMDPIAIETEDGTRLNFWDEAGSPYREWVLDNGSVPAWAYSILYERLAKPAA